MDFEQKRLIIQRRRQLIVKRDLHPLIPTLSGTSSAPQTLPRGRREFLLGHHFLSPGHIALGSEPRLEYGHAAPEEKRDVEQRRKRP
jgi:hypothetical protein